MIRLCVVGNSHASGPLSAFRRQQQRWPLLAADFSLTPGRAAPHLELRHGRFFPPPESLIRSTLPDVHQHGIDVSGFDAVLVSAVGVTAARNVHLESGYHPLGKARCFTWNGVSDLTRVSRAYMTDLVREHIRASGAFQFTRDLVGIFSGRVLVQRVPRTTLSVLEEEDWTPSP